MNRQTSLRLSDPELRMLRHALTIGQEDGSLLPQDDDGNQVPEYSERADRIHRKIDEALARLDGGEHGRD